MTESTSPLYPISETLISEYVTQGRADLLLSLFNSIKSQRDRAERVAVIYQQRIAQLEAREGRGDGLVYTKARAANSSAPKSKIGKPTTQRPTAVTADSFDSLFES